MAQTVQAIGRQTARDTYKGTKTMTDKIERETLLPCPFCGNDKNIKITNERSDNSGGYFIDCPECHASTGLRFAAGDDPSPLLSEQWNRRAPQPTEAQQKPVAWRHSKTGQLYDLEEEVPLADGDEWAEPLYAAPVAQQEPSAWRQWSTKQHDWDYQTNRGDLRPDTPADPLFVAAAQPEAIEQALQKIADFGQEQEPVAWLRIQEHENRPTTIHLCDSDHPKAFKVYATRPQPARLSDYDIDHALARTLDALAKQYGMDHAMHVRTDIAEHRTLRRAFARAIETATPATPKGGA
jgi:hypothetical protein